MSRAIVLRRLGLSQIAFVWSNNRIRKLEYAGENAYRDDVITFSSVDSARAYIMDYINQNDCTVVMEG